MQVGVRVCVWLAVLNVTAAPGRAAGPEHVRGTLVAIEDDLLTIEDEDEEQRAVALTGETGLYVVTPARFADIAAGQYVGVTSIESGGDRVALEVHVFAEDLRGTAEGQFPWDLVKEPNTMTNATIVEVEAVSPVERLLRLTYKDGEGGKQSEQAVRVPDFADVVQLASAPDRSVLVAGRPVFMLVEQAAPNPPTASAIAVGVGVVPPM
jgi:hypothetical protein